MRSHNRINRTTWLRFFLGDLAGGEKKKSEKSEKEEKRGGQGIDEKLACLVGLGSEAGSARYALEKGDKFVEVVGGERQDGGRKRGSKLLEVLLLCGRPSIGFLRGIGGECFHQNDLYTELLERVDV